MLRQPDQGRQEPWAKPGTGGHLIVVCCWCDRIRDKEGHWIQVDWTVFSGSGESFTHGICPECIKSMRRKIPG